MWILPVLASPTGHTKPGSQREDWMTPRRAEGQCVFLLAAKAIQPTKEEPPHGYQGRGNLRPDTPNDE
jgi:hypothetical protein